MERLKRGMIRRKGRGVLQTLVSLYRLAVPRGIFRQATEVEKRVVILVVVSLVFQGVRGEGWAETKLSRLVVRDCCKRWARSCIASIIMRMKQV